MYEFAYANLSYPQRYSYTPFGGLKFLNDANCRLEFLEKIKKLKFSNKNEILNKSKNYNFELELKSISFPDGQNYNIDKLEDIYKYGTDIIKAFESRKC